MATASLDTHSGLPTASIIEPWLCSICSSQDMTTDLPLCATCQQKFLDPIDDHFSLDHPKLAWHCPRCTLYNTIDRERCNACGTSKFALNHTERVIVNSAAPLLQTTTSMTVRDRRHRDESYAERIYQNIVKYCKQNKTNFVDDHFVPSDRSIGSGSFGSVQQWLRISNVAPSSDKDRKLEWTMFSSPQPSDIEQGALGNCWLVAVLALISERPRLLQHILLTKTINDEGVYLVRICHNGLWETVIVDDYFPCTKHKQLVFTKAKRRQLYIPLIEKACAKKFGSYANLTSGNVLEGLQLLTGAPCEYIDLKPTNHTLDTDIIWAKLLSACESGLLIGTSSGGTGVSPDEYAKVHINRNHAFSLLTAHTLNTKPYRFVLVRDPHSCSSYAEDSITGSVLQQLRLFKPTDRSTGAFWISWPQFLHYFSSITISTYSSDLFDIRERGKFTRSPTDYVTSYRFHVPQTSLVTISLLYHREKRTARSFHTQAFVLCDADDVKPNASVGKRESILIGKRGGFTYWSGSLRAGYYVLIPFSTSFWRQDEKHRNFTVVIHSSVHLDLTIKNKPSTFLADCLISAAMKISENKKQEKEAMFYITPSKLGLKVFVAENLSTKNLVVDIDMTIAKNVRHSRHSRLPYNTHDCIPPRHRQLVFITEWADKRGQSAQLNYTYSHQHHTRTTDPKPSIDRFHGDLHSPRAF